MVGGEVRTFVLSKVVKRGDIGPNPRNFWAEDWLSQLILREEQPRQLSSRALHQKFSSFQGRVNALFICGECRSRCIAYDHPGQILPNVDGMALPMKGFLEKRLEELKTRHATREVIPLLVADEVQQY